MIEFPLIQYGIKNVKLNIGFIQTTNIDGYVSHGGGGSTEQVLLLESGEEVLLENGSPILLEIQNK